MNEVNKKKFYILPVVIVVLLCTTALTGCGEADESSDDDNVHKDTGFAMGTVVDQTIYAEDNIASDIIDLLTETENTWISWRAEDSEIAEINRNAADGKSTEVSDQTAKYINAALKVASDSKGAFDPTIGKLTRLWDFDNSKNEVPDEGDIEDLVKYVGYGNINLKDNTVTMDKHTSIDLGAIGKGIGCDEIQSYIDSLNDIRGALINIGGSSILTYGKKDNGEPWKVAVLDPRNESEYLGSISIEGTNHISTSGDYERYFEQDGKRYHHILDPSTGFPADSGVMSVTVVTDNGANCDALSTACFVMGYEKALDLLAEYNAEAIFVDTEKNVYITEGLKDKFELIAEGYEIVSK